MYVYINYIFLISSMSKEICFFIYLQDNDRFYHALGRTTHEWCKAATLSLIEILVQLQPLYFGHEEVEKCFCKNIEWVGVTFTKLSNVKVGYVKPHSQVPLYPHHFGEKIYQLSLFPEYSKM